MTENCAHCNALLAQPKTGRPRKFCSESCKSAAKRRRGFGALASQFRGAPKPREEACKLDPARAAALGRAMARVVLAEADLRRAKAKRQREAEADPLEGGHTFRTASSPAELREGPSWNPGVDTELVAERIRRERES